MSFGTFVSTSKLLGHDYPHPNEDPWDYSVEGTQQRSLGGFSEEGLGACAAQF